MIIFPAIDIKNGRCVRLRQGKAEDEVVFSENPVEAALMWQRLGAEYLHIVDLDGAFCGRPVNTHIIKEIVNKVDIPVQLGGGIRKADDVSGMLDIGVSRVILGTSALLNKDMLCSLLSECGDKIAVSIDAVNGYAAVDGWTSISSVRAVDFAFELENKGLKTLIYTDISKDGMLSGPNFNEIKELKEGLGINIIASGGISTVDDVKKLREFKLYGAIIGKALYTGDINFKDIGGMTGDRKKDYSLS